MRPLLLGVLGCSLVLSIQAMYSSSDDVVELTPSNFNREVIQSDSLWLVEFYAPWCGHCQNLAPEWKKAATALKGIVKVGAVDADQHKSLGGQYSVRGFPTIKIFGANKNKPEEYQGGRSSQAIVDGAMNALRSLVKDRLSGKSGSSGYNKQSGGGGGGSKKDVVELTDDNFDKMVLESNDVWMVEFFAPWCGHCKNLEPEWTAAATAVKEQTKGKVRLGAVDATVHQVVSSRYGIRGFPTIKIFRKGEEPEDYQGGRTRGDIIEKALDMFSENAPPPELLEVNELFLITKTLTIHGAQMELEASLGIGGFGYPAMAAINTRKMKFALLRGSFSETGIHEFLRELSVGRGSTATLGGGTMPKIYSVEPWDGKDGQLPVEEDYDLSDVDLDDDFDKDEL
uniref:Protein disulfide-isomerase A6 n=1 Tax=Anabas testudineus TaxID=64144 RepID=A0A7N6A2Z5_ANATE